MTNLIETLDQAVEKMLETALAGDDLNAQMEVFKVAANWLERKTKLVPAKSNAGGDQFNRLRGRLHGTSDRAPKRRGAAPAAAEDQTRADA